MSRTTSLAFMRQLCHLRWLAVGGQALAVAVVAGPLGVPLPLVPLAAAIGLLALFNGYVSRRIHHGGDASDVEVFLHLQVDVIVLSVLIALSGGMENPFASLLLMPIALGILALPRALMAATAATSITGYFASTLFGRALPQAPAFAGNVYSLHMAGMPANFIISATVMLFFFTRMATAWRRGEQEISHLRERFTRNEGIVALATHAAAVAHELNTPLATLTLMVEELAEDARTPGQQQEAQTLKSLLELCRDRVRTLATPAGSGVGEPFTPVSLDDVIQQWQLIRPTIELRRSGSLADSLTIDPAVGHLLLALLNNAADASEQAGEHRIDLTLDTDTSGLRCQIRDYGVGFDQARPPLPAELFRSGKPGGLGLGLALSHATIERLGGELSMQATDGRGVRVEFSLPNVK